MNASLTATLSRLARGSVLSASVLAAVAAPAAGQDRSANADSLRLTLDDVLSKAVASSHRLAEAQTRVDAARASTDSRNAADKPVFSLLGGYTRTNHVDEYAITLPGQAPRVIYPDVPDNVRARVDMAWPVYTSGRLPALERAAGADLEAASRDVAASRADVRLDAARAFWSYVMAREHVKVVGESVARIEAHLRDVKTMLAAGLLAPNDVLSVEARRSRERVLLIEATNARDIAEADLRRVVGAPASTSIEPIVGPDGGATAVPALGALLVDARANRPERQALELRATALRERGVAAAAATRPVVSLAAGADYARPNPRIFPRKAEWNASFDIGVNVAWTVWDWGRTASDASEVAATRRGLDARLAEFDRQLEFDVTGRRLDLESATAAVGAATDAVTAATEAHRVVRERFKAGLVSNLDVLDAQFALVQAQLERTRATTAVRLAQARLDRVLGR